MLNQNFPCYDTAELTDGRICLIGTPVVVWNDRYASHALCPGFTGKTRQLWIKSSRRKDTDPWKPSRHEALKEAAALKLLAQHSRKFPALSADDLETLRFYQMPWWEREKIEKSRERQRREEMERRRAAKR